MFLCFGHHVESSAMETNENMRISENFVDTNSLVVGRTDDVFGPALPPSTASPGNCLFLDVHNHYKLNFLPSNFIHMTCPDALCIFNVMAIMSKSACYIWLFKKIAVIVLCRIFKFHMLICQFGLEARKTVQKTVADNGDIYRHHRKVKHKHKKVSKQRLHFK